VLADRIGGKVVLGAGVLWWSAATMLTPLAAHAGLVPLLAARAMMGIGEGVAMPAMNSLLSSWVPSGERSRSLSLVYSGMYTGSMIGLGLSPGMCQRLGWGSVFEIFGLAGLLWSAAWWWLSASSPKADRRISAAERAHIEALRTKKGDKPISVRAIPWRLLMSKPQVWAIVVAHFCHNWGLFILLTWMPTYYNQVLGMDLAKSGFYSVLPWFAMAISANVGGWLADAMVKRGVGIGKVRKVMQTVGFMGPAVALTILPGVSQVWQAVACMCLSQGLDAFSQSGLYSNHADIAPSYAGVLLGISNTAGVLAGVVGTYVTGKILAVAGWAAVWKIAVVMYVFGMVWFNIFASGEKIID